MHISTQLIQIYPREYGWWSCGKEKLSIPLEAHHKAQLSKIFKFSGKKSKELEFVYLLANPVETAYSASKIKSFPSTNDLSKCGKESGSSHLFGVGPGEADKTTLVQELSKAIIFCLRSYPCKISHSNSANQELSYRSRWCAEEKLHFTPGHTLRQLKRDEGLFPPHLPRRVSSEVRLENCTQVLG